jgi:O-antigen/teichoic acid export membrane protein
MAGYGFGLLLLMYRLTSREDTGRWLVFVSAISLADMMMHGFLQTPVIIKISKEGNQKETIDRIASNAFLFAAMIWVGLSFLIFTTSLLWHNRLLMDLRWYSLMGAGMVLYNLCWWVGHGLSDFRAVLIQRLLYCVSSIGIMVGLYLYSGILHIEHIIISQVAGYGIAGIVTVLFIRKIHIRWAYFDREHLLYFLHYGKFTSGSMIMGSLLRNADIFMIAGCMGQGAVAVYGAAQKTVEIFEVVLRGMASHSLPEFSRAAHDMTILTKKYIAVTEKLLVLFMLPALAMIYFSKDVIRLFSGSAAYGEASVLLRIFMVYVPFLVLDRMTGVVLEAMGMARHNLVKTFILVLVNIAGNSISLYYFHSMTGVAAVSIVAAITGFGAGLFFLIRRGGLRFPLRGFDRAKVPAQVSDLTNGSD